MAFTDEEKQEVELRHGPKKVIHVHTTLMKQGEPAIIVRTHRGSSHYEHVRCNGPFEVTQSEEPLRGCGAHIWITTHSAVHGS
jgi:hypothetical protein